MPAHICKQVGNRHLGNVRPDRLMPFGDQETIDQPEQTGSGGADIVQPVADRGRRVFQRQRNHLRRAVDDGQRRAQLMADQPDELILLLAQGGLGLQPLCQLALQFSPFRDLFFQRFNGCVERVGIVHDQCHQHEQVQQAEEQAPFEEHPGLHRVIEQLRSRRRFDDLREAAHDDNEGMEGHDREDRHAQQACLQAVAPHTSRRGDEQDDRHDIDDMHPDGDVLRRGVEGVTKTGDHDRDAEDQNPATELLVHQFEIAGDDQGDAAEDQHIVRRQIGRARGRPAHADAQEAEGAGQRSDDDQLRPREPRPQQSEDRPDHGIEDFSGNDPCQGGHRVENGKHACPKWLVDRGCFAALHSAAFLQFLCRPSQNSSRSRCCQNWTELI